MVDFFNKNGQSSLLIIPKNIFCRPELRNYKSILMEIYAYKDEHYRRNNNKSVVPIDIDGNSPSL